MRKIFFLFLIFLSGYNLSYSQEQSVADSADIYFNNSQFKEALQAYNRVLNDDEENITALWRSSVLYARLGYDLESEKKTKQYYNLSRERAEEALAVDSTSSQANFAMAVAMGRMAMISGVRSRVAAARDIKAYAEKAIAADSTNAGAWHVLGRWNYEVAGLNFAERLAANVLFGGIPGGASYEHAVEYIEQAISYNQDIIFYYRDIANAYEEVGREEDAVEACKVTLTMEAYTSEDEMVKADCRELIEDHQ